jgi:hypothetical protein
MDGIFLDVTQQAVMVVAGLLFSALSAVGTFYMRKLIAYLREKELLQIVSRYVRWAEQAPAFQDFSGEEKFEIVLSKVIMWLDGQGLDINEDELAIMVEEAVKKMKEAALPLYTGE